VDSLSELMKAKYSSDKIGVNIKWEKDKNGCGAEARIRKGLR
jgi:hypothetical protein